MISAKEKRQITFLKVLLEECLCVEKTSYGVIDSVLDITLR